MESHRSHDKMKSYLIARAKEVNQMASLHHCILVHSVP